MVNISRDRNGKTRVAKGDKTGLGGQYAPDPQKLAAAKHNMAELADVGKVEPVVDLGPRLNKYVAADVGEATNDNVKNVLFNKYGAKKIKSGSREIHDGTFLDPVDEVTVCECGEPVSKYELNNGAHVWSHDENPSKDLYVDMNGERESYLYDSFERRGLTKDMLEIIDLNVSAGNKLTPKVSETVLGYNGKKKTNVYAKFSPTENKHSAYPAHFCTTHGVSFVDMEKTKKIRKGLRSRQETVVEKVCPSCERGVISTANMSFR